MSEAFKYVKRGYDPLEVDQYIAKLEDVLKSYKDKDASIKNAILNAQIAADNIVKNAELKSDHITQSAIKQLRYINDSVERQKQFVSQFEADYAMIVKKYLTDFDKLQISKLHQELDNLQSYITSLSESDEDTPEQE